MNYNTAPVSVRSLEQRIRNLEGQTGLALRRRNTMALVVVSQMLPEGAVKGDSAMALRYGRETRFTRDLDVCRVNHLDKFASSFEQSLSNGWAGFTGRLIQKAPPSPPDIPSAYVMQPFEVKLDYRGKPWCAVSFELGHNELGDADDPEYTISEEFSRSFSDRSDSKDLALFPSCEAITKLPKNFMHFPAKEVNGPETSSISRS